jgi:hypothetical protein
VFAVGLGRQDYEAKYTAYLLLAVLGFPPYFVASKRLDLLAFHPRALWYDVSLYEALQVLARTIFSCASFVGICAQGIVFFWVLPGLPLQVAHHAVVRRQYRCVLCSIVQTASYIVDVPCEAAEDGDVLRLPYDIGYDNAGRHLAGRRHDVVAQWRLVAEDLEGLANGIEGARIRRTGKEQADACERICNERSGFHVHSTGIGMALL